MIGFVRDRRLARRNYNERIEYEDLIAKMAAEKKNCSLYSDHKLDIF